LVNPFLVSFWDSTGKDADLNRSPLMRFLRTHLVPLGTWAGDLPEVYELYGMPSAVPTGH
jgi:hypothetical protein